MKTWGTSTLIVLLATLVRAENVPPPSKPYPLPDGVQHTIGDLAAKTDVLILGEMHGTQETPEIATALLAPLTKQGYGILALEVPADQQAPLIAWATGKSSKIPWFYSTPAEDGRGSAEMLALIRTALSPPFRWRLICFDQSIEAAIQEDKSLTNRDKQMAKNFAAQRREIGGQAETLAICGNLHARTANHSPPDSFRSSIFPSFAANLQTDHPNWHINSINLDAHSGQFYNGGKPNDIYETKLDEPIAHVLADSDWNLQLDLPKATAATFLVTPNDENTMTAINSQLALLKKQKSESQQCVCCSRRGHWRRCR